MGFGRYRNTPLASIQLSDSITGLLATQAISADVSAAAEHAPLRFDPVVDHAFYQDIYWQCPFEQQVEAAKRLKRRFGKWYEHNARPVDKVYLAAAALTDSDDAIDTIIDDTKMNLLKSHRLDLIDSDDAIYQITDYHSVRDPVNINNLLNTEQFAWWCRQFEEQARRVLAAPTMEFDQLMTWNQTREDQAGLVRDHFRKNIYTQNGLTVKQGRKMLRRSYRFMASFYGEKQARAFCNGAPIEIRAHYFVWRIKLVSRRDLITNTVSPPSSHVPYALDLYDHEGQHVARACVIFDQLPVLDQAVALGISVATPEEELDFLRATNIYALSAVGQASSTLNELSLPNVTRPDPDVQPPWTDEQSIRLRELLDEAGEDQNLTWTEWICNVQSSLLDDSARPAETETMQRVREQRTREDELIDQYIQRLGTVLRMPNPSRDGFRGNVISLYGEVLRDRARIILQRQRDPIAQRIRREIYRRLDVPPDLIEYMALPEFRFYHLSRVKNAPRARQFIENKLLVGLGDTA